MPRRASLHGDDGGRSTTAGCHGACFALFLARYCTARSWTRAAEAYADRAATRRKLIIVVIREAGQPLRGYVLREAMRLLEVHGRCACRRIYNVVRPVQPDACR